MQHILIAAFDHYDEAEQVKRELMGRGVSQTDIQLATSNEASMSEDTLRTDATYETAREDESLGDRISGFFHSIFSSDEATSQRYADAYPEAIRHGSTVVTVTVSDEDQIAMVKEIMERNGAIDIDERSASWGLQSAETAQATDRTVIPIMEEELKVGRRESPLGRVRVVSRVTEHPVEETVNLTEQHAVIERHPVDRAASPEDLSKFHEETIEIQETAEEPVVSKSARVVEEIVVGKEATQHEETVHDTVRRTDVEIEKDDSVSRTGTANTGYRKDSDTRPRDRL